MGGVMIQSSAFLSNWSLPAALFIQAQVLPSSLSSIMVKMSSALAWSNVSLNSPEADAVRFGGDSHFFSYRCYRVVVIAQHVWQVFRENGRRVFGVYRIIAGIAHEDIFQ